MLFLKKSHAGNHIAGILKGVTLPFMAVVVALALFTIPVGALGKAYERDASFIKAQDQVTEGIAPFVTAGISVDAAPYAEIENIAAREAAERAAAEAARKAAEEKAAAERKAAAEKAAAQKAAAEKKAKALAEQEKKLLKGAPDTIEGKTVVGVKSMKAYSYTGGGHTASGKAAAVGRIAVDPKVIPLGTWLYVKGYGLCQACDIGGGIKGNTIDVYFNTVGECYKWGAKSVTVYVLK